MIMKRLFALFVSLSLALAPAFGQSVRNGGTQPTASATGGLTAAAGAFSFGGDSGRVGYTSPGALFAGKTGSIGSLQLFGPGTGSVQFQPNTGALGSTIIIWPAGSGTIGPDAFLGVGNGLLSSGGKIVFGDNLGLTYAYTASVSAYLTIGQGFGGGIKILTYNPNITNDINNNHSVDITCKGQAMFNQNLSPGFTNSNCVSIVMNTTNTDVVYSAGNSNGQTLAKTTSQGLLLTGNYLGGGQKLLTGYTANCLSMSDCAISTSFVNFSGGPIPGDEGTGFTDINTLNQIGPVPTLALQTITSIPTQSTCNTTLTQAINNVQTPQTVTVVDSSTCSVNDWIDVGAQIHLSSNNEEVVQISAVGANTLTGIFRHNWNYNLIGTLGAITGGSGGVDGTYLNVPLTGGTGLAAIAQSVVVSGGTVTAVNMNPGGVSHGHDFTAGDVLSAASGNIGGVTGFSVLVATTIGNTITPATVLNIPGGGGGQDRILVDISATPVTAGAVTSISNNQFTGLGTSWSPSMVGGNAISMGCIYLTADDNTQSPFNGTGVNGTLHSYYEIIGVPDSTHLQIHSDSTAGDSAYRGLGPGAGTYAIYPCAEILYQNAVNGQIQSQAVLNTTSFTWTAGDTVETAINPYPDVSAFQYHLFGYTPGGAWRAFLDVENNGPVPFQTGIRLTSQPVRTGFIFGQAAWNTGIFINQANIGLQFGPNIYSEAIQLTNGTASSGACPADSCGYVAWGVLPNAPFIGPNSTNRALTLSFSGNSRGLLSVIDTASGLISGSQDELLWPGVITLPAKNFNTFQACGTAMKDSYATMLANVSAVGATVTANGANDVFVRCNASGNWVVVN